MSWRHPPKGNTPPVGIPRAVWDPSASYNVETYAGDEANSRSDRQYVHVNSNNTTLTFPSPASGDVLTRGICQITADGLLGAFGGLRRQELGGFAANGFGAAKKTLWASRFQVPAGTVAPTAVDDFLFDIGGIQAQAAGVAESANGIYVPFDRTLAVPSYVVRATRASVPIQRSLDLPFDNGVWHTVGFYHRGSDILPFVDGLIKAPLTGAEIQPNDNCESTSLHVDHILGTLFAIQMNVDWVLWGPE